MSRFGDLDESFGLNGKVITDFGGSDEATSVAINPNNGKIIVAGNNYNFLTGNSDFALAGYLSNGSLDASFGINGLVTTDFGGFDAATSVAINPNNGKIIAAGFKDDDFALAGYLSNGDLDASFGTNGLVITDFGSIYDQANSVAIKPDGKIIVAGFKDDDFALAGYLSNGSLDASFGLNGKVITDFGGFDRANSLAIKPDGKIIVTGFTTKNSSYDFALACYLSNGSLDASFGTNGLVITDFSGNNSQGYSLAIKPDGKIIVAGFKDDNFALAGYLSNGYLDASFGTNGLVTTDFINNNENKAYSVSINPNGKIIVAGYNYNFLTENFDFALAGYLSNGSLDVSFGSNGLVNTAFEGNDVANSVAINQTTGKIIVAGFTTKNDSADFALACYFGEATEVPITEVPISNICFPANTLISTNQGNIAIQDLDPKIHTIRNKK